MAAATEVVVSPRQQVGEKVAVVVTARRPTWFTRQVCSSLFYSPFANDEVAVPCTFFRVLLWSFNIPLNSLFREPPLLVT